MIKRVISAVVLVVFPLILKAQSATTLLNEVSAKVKSYENIVIDFKYGLNNKAENLAQETNGSVILSKDKYLLNLMGTVQLFDGVKLHSINTEDEEITISDPDPESGLTPSKMLTFYQKGYKATMDIVQNVKGRKIQYVKLVPTKSSTAVKFILLGIDQQTKHIYNQILSQHNGTEITVVVNQFKTNQPLSNTLFTFDKSKYKGYYINKLD